jgi:ribosomal protein S18 acetylase RimI-like enzyme
MGKAKDFIPGRRPNLKAFHPYSRNAREKPTREMQLTFRKTNLRDLPYIIDLSKRVFSDYGPYDEIIAGWASLVHIITVVVEVKGEPRGFAMINPTLEVHNMAKGELVAIAVSPEYQRRGIGRRLLGYMEGLARNIGIQRMVIHTAAMNKMAQRFFIENGFVGGGLLDSYYPMGQKALEMLKTLSTDS